MICITNSFINYFIFARVIKHLTTIFLLFAFVTQTFRGGFVIVNYYTNTEAFAKNCINKAKPKLHCNGKCQMMKKMQEDEKKDQELPLRKFENKIEVLSNHSFTYTFEIDLTIIASKPVSFEKNYPLKDISYSFFHPPKA